MYIPWAWRAAASHLNLNALVASLQPEASVHPQQETVPVAVADMMMQSPDTDMS